MSNTVIEQAVVLRYDPDQPHDTRCTYVDGMLVVTFGPATGDVDAGALRRILRHQVDPYVRAEVASAYDAGYAEGVEHAEWRRGPVVSGCRNCGRPFGTGTGMAVHARDGLCTRCIDQDYAATRPPRRVNPPDPGICGIKWCTEAAEHSGPHRQPLMDTFAMDVQTGRPTICQLWLQGESARVRALVLVTGQCETGLTWAQSSQLADVVASAVRRWAQ